MANTLVQMRIDEDLKDQAVQLFDRLGLDLPTAIRIFLKKSVEEGGIPFELKIAGLGKTTLAEGYQAFLQLNTQAQTGELQDMSAEDINEEIRRYRRGE